MNTLKKEMVNSPTFIKMMLNDFGFKKKKDLLRSVKKKFLKKANIDFSLKPVLKVVDAPGDECIRVIYKDDYSHEEAFFIVLTNMYYKFMSIAKTQEGRIKIYKESLVAYLSYYQKHIYNIFFE